MLRQPFYNGSSSSIYFLCLLVKEQRREKSEAILASLHCQQSSTFCCPRTRYQRYLRLKSRMKCWLQTLRRSQSSHTKIRSPRLFIFRLTSGAVLSQLTVPHSEVYNRKVYIPPGHKLLFRTLRKKTGTVVNFIVRSAFLTSINPSFEQAPFWF